MADTTWATADYRSHGRDNKLIVWKVGIDEEERLSTALPLEDVPVPRPQPWILHLLPVNTMNFCSFAACGSEAAQKHLELDNTTDILVAVPHTLAAESVGQLILQVLRQLTL